MVGRTRKPVGRTIAISGVACPEPEIRLIRRSGAEDMERLNNLTAPPALYPNWMIQRQAHTSGRKPQG